MWEQRAEERGDVALLKSLPMFVLAYIQPSPSGGPGSSMEGKKRQKKQSILPVLVRDEFEFASRHLSPRLPRSYLQGEAVYR